MQPARRDKSRSVYIAILAIFLIMQALPLLFLLYCAPYQHDY